VNDFTERAADPAAALAHALDLSFRYLGRRDRSVAEVRHHLEGKRVEPATIDGAVEELHRLGYLDDARFARRFTEDRRTLDAWGADRIQRRLVAAGVAPEHIEQALGEQGRPDELAAAVGLLATRFAVPPADDRARERALGMLVRKGYELEVAYAAVRAFEHGE